MITDNMQSLREKLIDPANNPVREDRQSPQGISQSACQNWAMVFGGGMLAGMGLSRRSLPGLLVAATGGYLVYRGLTELRADGGRIGDEDTVRAGGGVQDKVDEASWESFPASDPPSHSPTSV